MFYMTGMRITDPEMKKAIETLFRRSQIDRAFRELCLCDPAAALEAVSGIRLEGQTIRFVESCSTEGHQEDG